MDSALGLAKVTETTVPLLCLKTQGSVLVIWLNHVPDTAQISFITIIIQIFSSPEKYDPSSVSWLGVPGYPGIPTQVTTPSSAPVPYPRPLPVLFWLHPGHLGVMVGMLV